MSNKNRNYTNYSKPNKPAETVAPANSEEKVQNIQSDTETTTNVTPEPQTNQPDPEAPKVVKGVVVDCEKLNIRADAKVSSEVLCVINKGEKVEIIKEKSTNDFYAVIYGKDKEVSIEGYCMKTYITTTK